MDKEAFVGFLNDYGDFNRAFAGAGLCLAGNCHLHSDLFGDEPAARIASCVLAALIDEYFSPDGKRHTHRDLCKYFVSESNRFFGSDRIAIGSVYLSEVQAEIMSGYAVDDRAGAQILSALGFHFATELNGVVEFTILDNFMRQRFAELVAYLEGEYDEFGRNPYLWVSAHVVVEHDHFAAAIEARDLAVAHYKRTSSLDEREAFVMAGIQRFYEIASSHLL